MGFAVALPIAVAISVGGFVAFPVSILPFAIAVLVIAITRPVAVVIAVAVLASRAVVDDHPDDLRPDRAKALAGLLGRPPRRFLGSQHQHRRIAKRAENPSIRHRSNRRR